MKYITNKICCIMVTIITLAGCGFHMRGAVKLPEQLLHMTILPDDAYDPFQKVLIRNLQSNGVVITAQDNTVLELSPVEFAESVVAFNAYGQPQQFRLSLGFNYRIFIAGTVLRDFTRIQVSRDLSLAPNQILSSENEKRTVKEELYQEASNQLLRQLAVFQIENL